MTWQNPGGPDRADLVVILEPFTEDNQIRHREEIGTWWSWERGGSKQK